MTTTACRQQLIIVSFSLRICLRQLHMRAAQAPATDSVTEL